MLFQHLQRQGLCLIRYRDKQHLSKALSLEMRCFHRLILSKAFQRIRWSVCLLIWNHAWNPKTNTHEQINDNYRQEKCYFVIWSFSRKSECHFHTCIILILISSKRLSIDFIVMKLPFCVPVEKGIFNQIKISILK